MISNGCSDLLRGVFWAAMACMGLWVLQGCTSSEAGPAVMRADIVVLSAGEGQVSGDRPAVVFVHDQHVDAIHSEAQDCGACHEKNEAGRWLPWYKAAQPVSAEARMNHFHDHCFACHSEGADAGKDRGPTHCGGCHADHPTYASAWVPMGFDISLHQRHAAAMGDQCESCHHDYDEATQTLVYVKGHERSCRDCHLNDAVDDTPPLNRAVHWACLGCHMERAETAAGEPNGPENCRGCHDADAQAQYAVLENPKRLFRNQPDFALLTVPEAEQDQARLGTVPFSHVGHEGFNDTCRVCHHKSMQACSQCHTLGGIPEGGQVTLQRAYHDPNANHSCVGCHDVKKKDQACAGCHDLMPKAAMLDSTCHRCHSGPEAMSVSGDPLDEEGFQAMRPQVVSGFSFTQDEIPETVTIAKLEDQYQPAQLPHRKIIERLRADLQGDRLATFFHGGDDTLCQGCHHHSPVGTRPPLCESCHGQPFDESAPGKPGLLGAYHQQCVGCHKSMNMEEPSACDACHKPKTQAAANIE